MSNMTLPSITYSSMEAAGLPAPLKSQMRNWIDRTLAASGNTQESARAIAKLHVSAAVEGVRATGEATVFGAILGGAHAFLPNGLDVKIPGTKINMPLDGAGAVLGVIAGVFAAQEPYGIGKTLIQGAASCASVFSFRKVHDLMVELGTAKSGVTPGGGATTASLQDGKIGKAAVFAGEGKFGSESGIIGAAGRGVQGGLSRIARAAMNL